MIRLKDLLREQAEPKKLRVLFVGDSQTVARWSYARQLLKNQDVTGSVIAKNGANTEWVLRQIQRIVANPDVKYDVISIFAGGNDGFKSKPDQAIANLSAAYTLAKQSGARVVAISNPTKKYIEQGNKYYNPNGYPANDEIAAWINSQDISDVTIDTNSYTKTSFMRDNVHLSPDAQRRIVDTWKSKILNTTTTDTSATTQPTTTVTRGGATSLTKSAGGSVTAALIPANYSDSAEKQAAALLSRFEGFRDKPYWDVNNWRVGYGSSTVTDSSGKITKLSNDRNNPPNITVSREDAENDLTRRLQNEFIPKVTSNIPSGVTLNDATIAALTSVAYNYGSLPKNVRQAIKTGDKDQIAQAVEALKSHNGGINAKRRQQEADYIANS